MVDSNSMNNHEDGQESNEEIEGHDYLDDEKKIDEELKDLLEQHRSIDEKLTSILGEFSSNDILDSIRDLYQFSLQSDQIEDQLTSLQQQLQNLRQENANERTNQLRIIQNSIEPIRKDLLAFQEQLENITETNSKQIAEEVQSNSLDSQSDKVPPSSSLQNKNHSEKKKSPVQLVFSTLKNSVTNKPQETPTLSHLLIRQASPAILDLPDRQRSLSKASETELEINNHQEEEGDEDDDDEEVIIYLDDKTASKINHKVRFSNNIVRYLRGPFKAIVHGTMHAVDVVAQGTHISDSALQAVKKGLARQNETISDEEIAKNCLIPTYTEIGSNWIIEGENPDRGYSSPSIWMRDPDNRRILAKIQEHPLCAANEWLAFVMGKFLGLPVNQVQIAIYNENLVSLHVDVATEDEKTTSFMDLPKQKRKELVRDPIMERMDIFDRIIQNVDRNQQNILITYPKTMNIEDNDVKFKVHLIDHSNCFGMGKLNGISLVASKFHSNHLAVVKFDPIQKSRQFEQYLIKLPVQDRPLIGKTLIRFSSITNEQIDCWMNQIEGLLSTSQYNRIYGVLHRQRDIAKRYIDQWGLSTRTSSIKSNENQSTDTEELVTRL